MTFWLILYALTALAPPLLVVWAHGWRSGQAGSDVSDDEEIRSAMVVGLLWPAVLLALLVYALAYGCARVLDPMD